MTQGGPSRQPSSSSRKSPPASFSRCCETRNCPYNTMVDSVSGCRFAGPVSALQELLPTGARIRCPSGFAVDRCETASRNQGAGVIAAELPAQVCQGFIKQPFGALRLVVVDVEFSKVFRRPNRLFALISLNPLKSFFCSRQHRQSLVAPDFPVKFSDQKRRGKRLEVVRTLGSAQAVQGRDQAIEGIGPSPRSRLPHSQAEHRAYTSSGSSAPVPYGADRAHVPGGCRPGRRDRVQDTTVRSSGGSMPQRGDDSRTARRFSRRRGRERYVPSTQGPAPPPSAACLSTLACEEIIPDEVITRSQATLALDGSGSSISGIGGLSSNAGSLTLANGAEP